MKLIYLYVLFVTIVMAQNSWAYPENIRHGYTSCKSCHFSPTGGGTLTPYGRRLAEEIQSTWSRKDEADLLHGAVKTPEMLQIGGDIRSIAYKRETESYKESRRFLMQADLEVVGSHIWKGLSAAVNGGYYDEESKLRRAYLMYDFSPSFSLRAGQFMPSFGINTPEHEIATKRPLGFNEGSEVMSVEANYSNEQFEVFLTGFSGEKGEKRTLDSGFTLNGAWFLGNRSKVGISAYMGDGVLHNRTIVGPYAIVGFTEQLYLLSELDYQKRSIKSPKKSLIEDEEGIFSYNKFGWEFVQGLHTFAIYETARPTASESRSFYDGYGAGLTWFPRPHFETQILYEKSKLPGAKRTDGDMWLGMMHYYL